MLSFKPAFSLPSLTFIKRLFSSSLFSAMQLVSSVYLRLLIFLPAILIPACASSSLTCHTMYSVYQLNQQGDSIQPWHTRFPVWNQSVVPCQVLNVPSWPTYRFLRRQIRWSGIPISWNTVCCDQMAPHSSTLAWKIPWTEEPGRLQSMGPQRVGHDWVTSQLDYYTVKGFHVINKAEVDVFLEFSCFFYDPVDVGNLISGSSAFSKTNLNNWKFTFHVLLKPDLENFEHFSASVWDECSCALVWTFFGIACLWDRNENWQNKVI